jgi:hypothetical protein
MKTSNNTIGGTSSIKFDKENDSINIIFNSKNGILKISTQGRKIISNNNIILNQTEYEDLIDFIKDYDNYFYEIIKKTIDLLVSKK